MSRYKIVLCVSVVLLALGAMLPNIAQADIISLTNASFETPVLADGTNTGSADLTGWVKSPSGTSAQLIANSNTETDWPGVTGNNPAVGGDGANMLFVRSTIGALSKPIVYQNTTTAMQAGYTYTLTAAVGKRAEGGLTPMDNFYLDIATTTDVVWNEYLARHVGWPTELTYGQLVDISVSYTATEADAGQFLRVVLSGRSESHTFQQSMAFDNVRLTSALVPEPGVLTLLGIGVTGLLAYAWRKRK